ncbi:hypothetical protein vseg_006509 [Gypsophila vaccaria]
MELNASSIKSGDLSPPDCSSDPDEKEVSDNDDDDRNHKHRRRDIESQSLERDPLEQGSTQPYRKRNRPFENGQNDIQSQSNLNRDFPKRRLTNFSHQFGEHGSGRGRGRGRYLQQDSRFGSMNVPSQMAHRGSIPPAMFAGRGLPASNAQSASWSGFGLVPTIPNGINSLGLHGILGPQMNPALNMGIQRQRCRDFEERGFCLRGDMCPMEHGVNRIVVEDVQSLSQFNLPVSIPSAQILGSSLGSGFVPSTGVSSTLMNSRGPHNVTDKCSMDEVLAGPDNAMGADVYDPDQPLWNNDACGTSSPMLGSQPSNFDENVSFADAELSDRLVRSSGDVVGGQSTSSSVWGRLRNSKKKLELKEEFGVRTNAPEFPTKEIGEPSSGSQGNFHVGKQHSGPNSKLQNDVGGAVRKPSQKAQRTLFVNCIPLKDNKRENLLSHFRKFGEVVDIFIPPNSERAFVQFSKREEAEKALKAPDAVMGSRFIKLWWANRDSITDNGVSSANNASSTPHDVMAASGSPHTAVSNKGKDGIPYAAPKVIAPKVVPIVANSLKAAPPAQKKMENLELLKEQLRRKQEMLERKRKEFRQQLDKLAKQASGKSDILAAPAERKQISKTQINASKVGNTQPSGFGISVPSSEVVSADEMVTENLDSQRDEVKSAGAKHPILSMATSGGPSHKHRYKLDNRPTTFTINARLPGRLINVAVLRDHFSLYGDISNLEIEDSCEEDSPKSPNRSSDPEVMKNCSARVCFTTRHAAERAFVDGKVCHGHNLQFSWVTSSIPASSKSSGESSSALKGTLNEVQSAVNTVNDDSQMTLDPKECTSSLPKSSNEPSCDSSRSSDERNSPVEKHSSSQVQSSDKSTDIRPPEVDEPEKGNSEAG